MILNEKQIEEIESSLDDGIYVFTGFNKSLTQNLLETVKALRKENDEQRELLEEKEFHLIRTKQALNAANEALSVAGMIGVLADYHSEPDRDELKQIEEHLK